MKNNKGFTLIELLAVIVILLGLSLATAWGITSILESRDEKEQEEPVTVPAISPEAHVFCPPISERLPKHTS